MDARAWHAADPPHREAACYTLRVAKDRATPFSFKHRRTWLTVTGGMIAIGVVNVTLGYLLWPDEPMDRTPERIIPQLPAPSVAPGEPAAVPRDAGPPDGEPAPSR